MFRPLHYWGHAVTYNAESLSAVTQTSMRLSGGYIGSILSAWELIEIGWKGGQS